ncbi:hypothetical protein RFI_25295 [Reticulomyxa filosa]|uniref:Uncharacterized protein n=1 Tax=Reticulomyxa filosa TaxID=46433 RepID=X6MG99_RETFI|nr:hypothetical protein RFI_25295 [Reticulomyxa filosa]|eukprot:ETO12080.1 hypothetical protein RFI_25295 [Reticulomyxa filosa]
MKKSAEDVPWNESSCNPVQLNEDTEIGQDIIEKNENGCSNMMQLFASYSPARQGRIAESSFRPWNNSHKKLEERQDINFSRFLKTDNVNVEKNGQCSQGQNADKENNNVHNNDSSSLLDTSSQTCNSALFAVQDQQSSGIKQFVFA